MSSSNELGCVEPFHSWTPQERWAWKQVQNSEIADFNEEEGYGGRLDPKKAAGWTPERVLRPEFLLSILLEEPYRSTIPHSGVQIIGACFKDYLDLSYATLSHLLLLGDCRFEGDVCLLALQSTNHIAVTGSNFIGRLNMNGLQVSRSLFMHGGAEFAEVDLGSAKIEGQVSMVGSNFTRTLKMNSLRVSGDLLMRRTELAQLNLRSAKIDGHVDMGASKFTDELIMSEIQIGGELFMCDEAEFAEVDLGDARIERQVDMCGSKFTGRLDMNGVRINDALLMRHGGEFADVDIGSGKIEGQVDMSGSKFTGKLIMSGVQVGGDLFMRDGAEFAEADLGGARIEGHVGMDNSTFTGRLNMDSFRAGLSLFMRGVTLAKSVDLIFGEIRGNLDISGSELPSFDLTGTKILGELRLGSDIDKNEPVRWHQGATLTLRNVEVGALQDREDAWPEKILLDGFSYTRLGGLAGDSSNMAGRDINWLKKWLEKSEYSPQPYKQLASVLERAGLK